MLALVGTVMLRSASGKVLLRDGDGVLGTHRHAARAAARVAGAVLVRCARRRPVAVSPHSNNQRLTAHPAVAPARVLSRHPLRVL